MMHPGHAHEAQGQKNQYWVWILAHVGKKTFEVKAELGMEVNCALRLENMHGGIM